jgi:hypothetical protein
VYVGYCSADAWLAGGVNQTVDGTMFRFAGVRILRAVLTHLVTFAGLGRPYRIDNTEAVHRVLLAGGGAGAMGVMANMDSVSEWLLMDGVGEGLVSVTALLDAPAAAPVPPLAPAVLAPLQAAQAALSFFNVTATQLSEGCLAANPMHPGACLFAGARLPFAKTPYLLYLPQYDKRQLTLGMGARVEHGVPLTAPQLAYASALRAAAMDALPVVKGTSSIAFSPACVKGPLGLHPTFWGVRAAPPGAAKASSMRDLLNDWFFPPPAPPPPAPGTPGMPPPAPAAPALPGLSSTDGDSLAPQPAPTAPGAPPPPWIFVPFVWVSPLAGAVVADACTGYACGAACRHNGGHPRNPDKTLHLSVIVPPPPPPQKTYHGLLHWFFRILVFAGVVGAGAIAVHILAPMAEGVGLSVPKKSVPRGPGEGEGTPLITRTERGRAGAGGVAALPGAGPKPRALTPPKGAKAAALPSKGRGAAQ